MKLEDCKIKILKEWANVFLTPYDRDKYFYTTPIFMESYLSFDIESYKTKLILALKVKSFMLYLTKCYILFNSETRVPGRFRWNDLKLLLPEPLEELYINELKKCYSEIYDNDEKTIAYFVLSALLPKEFPEEF